MIFLNETVSLYLFKGTDSFYIDYHQFYNFLLSKIFINIDSMDIIVLGLKNILINCVSNLCIIYIGCIDKKYRFST